MKKYLSLVLALMVFIPMTVLALEKPYEYFDFKVEKTIGEKIKDTEIKIYASVEGDETNLTERTSEFNLEEVTWSVCTDVDCSLTEEVAEDAIFEEDKDYVLMIKITTKNGADINVKSTDKVKYNGTIIEELSGEFDNTGNELMIKTETSVSNSKQEVVTPTAEPEEKKEENPVAENDKCLFGFSFCCNTFLGLSICIWIIIIVVLIILVISILMYRAKKKTDEQLAQL